MAWIGRHDQGESHLLAIMEKGIEPYCVTSISFHCKRVENYQHCMIVDENRISKINHH